MPVGGEAPISIQSMTNTDTRDVEQTVGQILKLEAEGCEIVRSSVYDMECAKALSKIKERIHIPLVADVHFDYRLAIAAVENGADKLRINPGNIGDARRVKLVADCCKAHHTPIRVGVNAGSLSKEILDKFGVCAKAMEVSALANIRLLEEEGMEDIVLSVKASDVNLMVESYRLLASKIPYPMHLGVTEAGTERMAVVKSAVGIGALLLDGIGDTIRVSITGDPVKEVTAAKDILKAVGLRRGVDIVSCPTCGRCSINIEALVEETRQRLGDLERPLKIAIMGCVVNGPGEAREADFGIACNRDDGIIFKKGEPLRRVSRDCLVEELLREIDSNS